MRISDNMNRPGPLLADDFRAVFDQSFSNPAALHAGIDEQTVEFNFTVLAWLNGCKPSHRALALRNEHSAASDLLKGHLNRIRMSKDRIPIPFIGERSTRLQLFEFQL